MSKEKDKNTSTANKTEENTTTSSNEGFGSKMAQKLVEALTKNLPPAWRSMPDENENKSSSGSWFPWGGSDKPGGVV